MKKQEKEYIEQEVKSVLMPEIKALLPGFLGFLIRAFFPKLEKRIIDGIILIVEAILNGRKG